MRQLFDTIDWLNRGFITKQEIKRVIDANAQHVINSQALLHMSELNSTEMEALTRRFNKDKLNGKISMVEFIDELSTKLF